MIAIWPNHPECVIFRVSLYFILFGFHGEPFLELLPNLSEASLKDNKNVRLFLDNEGIHQCTSMGSNYTGPIPITPESTRLEVQVQRNDFNARLKQIMFNTLISTYYATFIPCVFTPSALSFELFWVVKHSVTVFFGCGTLYFIHLYPSDYIHMMHRTAKNLGQWGQIEGRISHAFYSTWSPTQVWPINSFVRVDKSLYKSEGLKNCAEPGNLAQFRFYVSPKTTHYLESKIMYENLFSDVVQRSDVGFRSDPLWPRKHDPHAARVLSVLSTVVPNDLRGDFVIRQLLQPL